MAYVLRIAGSIFCLVPSLVFAAEAWKPAPSPLMTRWAKDVSPTAPLPEYPRPQFVRDQWQNLNGLWDYALVSRDIQAPPTTWDGKILVPFPIESSLSGVKRDVGPTQALWYHTQFTVPADWREQVVLNFGAVDWSCRVFVNDTELPVHEGGYDGFRRTISHLLRKDQPNDLVVRVDDPTDDSHQPRGKQIRKPEGIWYTPVTGIWQTVWLEPQPHTSSIDSLKITPDVDQSQVHIEVSAGHGLKRPQSLPVRVQVREGERVVAEAMQTLTGQGTFALSIPQPKLWTPDSPHLYDIDVAVTSAGGDRVRSYLGMRKIERKKDAQGVNRLFLNNAAVFQFGPLDQGWWPDGLYTAPTDEALKFDIEFTKKLGFNMCRKHVKVEPSRWYYWCDKLGLLVWQDMPSGDRYIGPNDPDYVRSPAADECYRREWQAIIRERYNHPSIICWVPFNEGWGQYNTNEILKWTKELDPTRLVDGPSGWTDRGEGDMHDMHNYPGPNMPPLSDHRASVLGEYGGLGWPVEGHLWLDKGNWGYQNFKNRESLAYRYQQQIYQLQTLIEQGLSAAVYTQTTDVEIEVNGLITYDRAIEKLPAEAAAWNRRVYGPPPQFREVVPTSEQQGQAWKWTTAQPADGWMMETFDDSTWKQGEAGFGDKTTPGTRVRTEWHTNDIWCRRTFPLDRLPAGPLCLRIHHDEDAEVYLNGKLIGTTQGYVVNYIVIPTLPHAAQALKIGLNTLAVHCRETGGGQSIDVGLVEELPAR